ncbi:hypothetical protein AB1283_01065 [Bacillus sp. S13(2024)]|uniref:hypothetical protein n=1 Tax=Bacillus sp. S13(2024) TaxID=3162885 RepID=UPI003D1BEFEA
MMPPKPKERVGIVGVNNFGSKMEIVEYNRCDDMWVKFEEYGNLVNTTWGNFNKGSVRNPYDKSIYGIGYLGEGEYHSYESHHKPSSQYKAWSGMMTRCYSEAYLNKRPTYEICVVSEQWYNFQNFAKWYDENYYEIEGQRMELDKDTLVKGNKVYSPETCVFVPNNINCLFTKTNSKRGDLPIGVSFYKKSKKYASHCNNGKGEKVTIGYYTSPEDAFNSYKTFKEKVIKQIAEEHKSKIPNKLYEALMEYRVEITD